MNEKLSISIIIASVREGRLGERVGRWVNTVASGRPEFAVTVVDLKERNFPLFAEPVSPSQGNYKNPVQVAWATEVGDSDGFILVTPEYNHGYPPSLKNALDYIYAEWNLKPVGFVSYSNGGMAGARSVEQLRQVVIDLQLVPMKTAIHIAKAQDALSPAGQPTDPTLTTRLETFLDQLAWWATVLKRARTETPFPKARK